MEETLTITEWCKAAWENSKAHGFTEDDIPCKLMLIVTEVSEAMEDFRNYKMDHFPEELADVCIRIFSLAGYHGIDLEGAIKAKHEKNKARPFKHGGKRC